TETPPTGFTQTVPASGGITVVLPANGSSVGNLFGNFAGVLTGTIAGTKFNDLNGNGVRDPGEPGLGGVTISLAPRPTTPCAPPPAVPSPIASTVTAADGSFSFANVAFGSYFVSETVPAGFARTVPLPPGILVATLDAAHPTVSGLLFGNQALVTG